MTPNFLFIASIFVATLTLTSACNTKNNSIAHDTQTTGEAAGNHEIVPASKTDPAAMPSASATSTPIHP